MKFGKIGKETINLQVKRTIPFDELVSLGVFEDCATMENFIDKELVQLFLYKSTNPLSNFVLQKEEVSGIVKVKLDDFEKLWSSPIEKVQFKGLK